jgi:hypothetical protein
VLRENRFIWLYQSQLASVQDVQRFGRAYPNPAVYFCRVEVTAWDCIIEEGQREGYDRCLCARSLLYSAGLSCVGKSLVNFLTSRGEL